MSLIDRNKLCAKKETKIPLELKSAILSTPFEVFFRPNYDLISHMTAVIIS